MKGKVIAVANSVTFYKSLEGLRGLGVFLVLISHFIIVPHFPGLIFLKFGYLGVNFFFVLSGFLITEILFKEINRGTDGRKILKSFYFKRLLRIFPIYYIAIIILVIVKVGNIRQLFIWAFTYTYNIGSIWYNVSSDTLWHTWSLCVEEQFYIVWPLLLLIFSKKAINHAYLIVSAIILSLVIKAVYVYSNGNNVAGFTQAFTPSAMDALALGSLLAYMKIYKPTLLNSLLKWYYLPAALIIFFWVMLYRYTDNSAFYLWKNYYRSYCFLHYRIWRTRYENLFQYFFRKQGFMLFWQNILWNLPVPHYPVFHI